MTFSVDIEADGPIPGMYSMLSMGAAAFQMDDSTQGWRQLGAFKRNRRYHPRPRRFG